VRVSERTSRYGGMLLVAAVTLIGAQAARANEQIRVGKAQGTAWTFLPVDIGIEQGFFAQQGLDIDSADLGGDAKVRAISAASIIAKVYRDRLLVALHAEHPQYGFDGHKGYSTPEHLSALREHGACPHHRRSFAPVRSVLDRLF